MLTVKKSKKMEIKVMIMVKMMDLATFKTQIKMMKMIKQVTKTVPLMLK